MGNCLVTKLKESVNNPDLSKLGVIRMNLSNSNSYIVNYASGSTGDVKSINNDSVNQVGINRFSNGLYPQGLPENTIIELTNKYEIEYLSLEVVVFNISDLAYSPLTTFYFLGNRSVTGDVLEMVKSSHNTLTELRFMYLRSVTLDNIYDLFSVMGSQFLTCEFSYCEKVGGTIDSLLPLTLPNGLAINVSGTAVTATQSAIDTLAGRGVTVTILPEQIIG